MQIGMFLGVDPLTEKFPNTNPFAFPFNNPIRYSDPTGMEGEDGVDPIKHIVKKGETLSEISKHYGVNIDEIQKTNNIENKHKIYEGQVITIQGDTKNKEVSKADMILATIGTNAYLGEILSKQILRDRTGVTSGKLDPKSPKVYNKASAYKANWISRGVGWGLSIYSFADTYDDYANGKIDKYRRNYNYLNTSVGLVYPRAAIPIAVGDYLGQSYTDEIVNDVSKPGGYSYELTKFMLELLNIPISAEYKK